MRPRLPLLSVVLLASAFLWTLPARADVPGDGLNPPPPTQTEQKTAGGNPPPVAKREEEEDGTISASRLQQLAAAFRTKGSLADDVATLKATNLKLSGENDALRTRIVALEKENTQMKADWDAIEKGLLEPEDAGDAAAKAAAAIEKKAAAKTAQELRGMSHPSTKLPGKGAEPSADVKPPTRQQLAAADRQAYWAKRKAPWATTESN
jgi:hypothetical protein